jgi:hypothetical protein
MRVVHPETDGLCVRSRVCTKPLLALRRFIFTVCVEKSVQLIVQVVCWPKGCESFRGVSERRPDFIVMPRFAGKFQIKNEFI